MPRRHVHRATPRSATEARDDNRRAVDEAKALGAPCIVLVVGGLPQYSRPGSAASKDIAAARAQVEDAIAEMLDYAQRRPACRSRSSRCIRPMPPTAPASTRRSRRSISATGSTRNARARSASRSTSITSGGTRRCCRRSRAPGKDRLLAFHVCDWLVPTQDILNDRGMMGDGVIDIKALRGAVEAQGFAGYSEIEIFSNDWWEKPMDEVLQTCIARHRSVV